MRVNIYYGETLIEYRRYFRTLESAKLYCKYVLPRKIGPGTYYPVILAK